MRNFKKKCITPATLEMLPLTNVRKATTIVRLIKFDVYGRGKPFNILLCSNIFITLISQTVLKLQNPLIFN